MLGDYGAAAYTYDTLTKVDKPRAEYYYLGAVSLANSGDQDGAENRLESGKSADAKHEVTGYAEAMEALGAAYMTAGDEEKADELYQTLVDEGFSSTEVYNRWMMAAMEKGNYEEALQHAEAGLALSDDRAKKEIAFNQAVCYEYLGQYEKALELMKLVGITDAEKRIKNYPHQLSGGMRQRVVIAIALACNPDLLICDEPTTALDVTIQAKIIELIRRVQKERGISVIYITHDLGVVAKVADYVNVMYAGKIVEKGMINEIFYDPKHPYTWGLLSAMPDLDTADERLYTIPGSPPNLLNEKPGDAFAPRNQFALEIDDKADPPMFQVTDTHYAATWLLDPRAPKAEMPLELKERIARMKKEAKIDDGE